MTDHLPDTNVGNIEYIRKQDALDAFGLSEKTRKYGGDHSGYDTRMLYEIQDTIESLEPADVAPVVRCRKCKYFWTYQCMDSMPIETCELAQTFYNPDLDFCSLAKRREE